MGANLHLPFDAHLTHIQDIFVGLRQTAQPIGGPADEVGSEMTKYSWRRMASSERTLR